MADSPKVSKYLHLPFQSGSNRILKLMNRGYTREDYLSIIKKARRIIPDIELTTDIIVGFPGEKQKEFEETLKVLKEVRFNNIYGFKYSDRTKIASSSLPDKIPEKEKEKRLNILFQVQKQINGVRS